MTDKHAGMLKNRVLKTYKKLAPGFRREDISAFRLYDWDIPEVRVVVDWYDGHIVVAEYERTQTADLPDYTHTLALACASALGISPDHVHTKVRRTRQQQGDRYEKRERAGKRHQVVERGLKFWVNFEDFLDCGLFMDHRETRARVRREAKGKRVLNLFCYTGSFSVYAAAGGATVTSVDASRTYLDWAEDNFALNGLRGRHQFLKDDTREHLRYGYKRGERYDIVVCDPPSFSQGRDRDDFDVQRDHPELVQLCLQMLHPGGVLYFSTNHQRFEPNMPEGTEEITASTVPHDYRNRQAHRCFRLVSSAPKRG